MSGIDETNNTPPCLQDLFFFFEFLLGFFAVFVGLQVDKDEVLRQDAQACAV